MNLIKIDPTISSVHVMNEIYNLQLLSEFVFFG